MDYTNLTLPAKIWIIMYFVIICSITLANLVEKNLNLPLIFIGIILVTFIYVIYFIPFIVANLKKHTNELGIFVVNLAFGWTFLGWIVALVWSLVNPIEVSIAKKKKKSKPKKKYTHKIPLNKLKLRLAEGKISEEEFKKKKELLK